MQTEKQCERCGKIFCCNAADIEHCECSAVKIPGKEIEYIRMHYRDCLCVACLRAISETLNAERDE